MKCARHGGTDAPHHNTWVGLDGKPREADLCDACQVDFLLAWSPIEQMAKPRKPRGPQAGTGTIIRAWAKTQGIVVGRMGRVSFDVELAWRKAGCPNVLED